VFIYLPNLFLNKIKYGLCYKLYDLFIYRLSKFIENVWIFRKVLWNHRWWDYHYTLEVLRTSLECMEKGMHNGIEIRETRDKKIKKIQRVIQIIKNIENDIYIEMAENELGKTHTIHEFEFERDKDKYGVYRANSILSPEQEKVNKKIVDLAKKMEEDEWVELWGYF